MTYAVTKFFHFAVFLFFCTLMRGFVIKSAADRPETFRSEFYAVGLPSLLQITGLRWPPGPERFFEDFVSGPETTDFWGHKVERLKD